MDEIITKIREMIAEINESEGLGIDFADSYIEDLAKHYVSRELTDDELRKLIIKLKQAYDRAYVCLLYTSPSPRDI